MQDSPLQAQQFSLRFLDIQPNDFPMEQLGEFVRLFAELIGTENKPRFKTVLSQSTAAVATTASEYGESTRTRLYAANDPSHKAYKIFCKIESKMLEFGLRTAELRDITHNQLIHRIQPANDEIFYRVVQNAKVDGEIVGIVGRDDTMHVTVREYSGRILKLIANLAIGRELGKHLRGGYLRLQTHGTWNRTASGWVTDKDKCKILSFSQLEHIDVVTLFQALREIPHNGWQNIQNPEQAWRDLRGLDENT
jgi:hypothetical protein